MEVWKKVTKYFKEEDVFDEKTINWPKKEKPTELDDKIDELTNKYSPDARNILQEMNKIALTQSNEDPSNFCSAENPLTKYILQKLVDLSAVSQQSDIKLNKNGIITWMITDEHDETPFDKRKVIFYNGRISSNIENNLNKSQEEVNSSITTTSPKFRFEGIVSQIYSTKILLETKHYGSLKGLIIVSICSLSSTVVAVASQEIVGGRLPNCVVLTEGIDNKEATENEFKVYVGQLGHAQINVEVVGQSCHGSMPTQGINPLECGSMIIAEASEQAKLFPNHKFLGKGSRTCTSCKLDTPSDCAVPARYVFVFDRYFEVDESEQLLTEELNDLRSVEIAKKRGCKISMNVDKLIHSWVTPLNNFSIKSLFITIKKCQSEVPLKFEKFAIPIDDGFSLASNTETEEKNYVEMKGVSHPPMFGFTTSENEIAKSIGLLSKYPSVFINHSPK